MSLGEPNNGHWYSGMENFINRPTPTQLKDKDLLKKILLADTTKFMVIHRNAGKRQRLEVLYNEEETGFGTLLQVFFGSHDPTTLNRQGPDRGEQYRSIAFYKNEQEKKLIQDYIKLLENNKVFDKKIVTQILPFEVFYYAEEYHQNYERLNPEDPYVINVSIPRINRFKKLYPELLKESFNN